MNFSINILGYASDIYLEAMVYPIFKAWIQFTYYPHICLLFVSDYNIEMHASDLGDMI